MQTTISKLTKEYQVTVPGPVRKKLKTVRIDSALSCEDEVVHP